MEESIWQCGQDIQKLLELALAYKTAGDRDAARTVHDRVLAIDPENREAHVALRHHNYDGRWFEGYQELSRYRRDEASRQLEGRER